MQSSASKSPNRVTFVAVATVAVFAAVLGTGSSRAQGAVGAAPGSVVESPPIRMAAGPSSVASRFPDVVLKTHDGKPVRFYEDLVRGKIVMINFMYATCKGR